MKSCVSEGSTWSRKFEQHLQTVVLAMGLASLKQTHGTCAWIATSRGRLEKEMSGKIG